MNSLERCRREIALCWVLSLLACDSPQPSVKGDRQGEPLDFSVRVARGTPEMSAVEVCLRPRTESLEVREAALPWGHRYSMFLAAFPADVSGNDPLPARLPVSDPAPWPTTTLAAGEERCGSVSLVERFDGWEEETRRRDIHVFWAWSVVRGGERVWFTGGLTIPRATTQ